MRTKLKGRGEEEKGRVTKAWGGEGEGREEWKESRGSLMSDLEMGGKGRGARDREAEGA